MELKMVNIEEIIPYENNPRFNDDAVDAVKKSIQEYGFKVPMVLDSNNVIVCGHTRYRAAKALGLSEVPCVIASDLSEKQIKAFRIADNKTSDFSIWDNKKLVEEFQLDDNIVALEILYEIDCGNGVKGKYSVSSSPKENPDMINDYIDIMVAALEHTNAGMTGFQLRGVARPDDVYMRELYCYSFFCLDLTKCAPVFHGDFEDDIEYRLKLRQMGIPSLMIYNLRYGKTSQAVNKDLTGCRAEYLKAGLKRGDHMRKLYSDVYSCRMETRAHGVMAKRGDDAIHFKHYIKPFKVGVVTDGTDIVDEKMRAILDKYRTRKPDKVVTKEKKLRKKA